MHLVVYVCCRDMGSSRYSEEVNLVLQQAGPLCTHGFIHKSKMQITQTRKDFLPL